MLLAPERWFCEGTPSYLADGGGCGWLGRTGSLFWDNPGPAKKLDMLACVSPSLRPALLTGFGLFAPAASAPAPAGGFEADSAGGSGLAAM